MSGYRENAKLTAYALGELGTREARGVERDVAKEAKAAEVVDEVLEVAALLKDEFEAEPELFLTAEQRAAILRGEKAGVSAPPGRRMGHAGAIISGEADTANAKMDLMEELGVHVVRNPALIGEVSEEAAKDADGEDSTLLASLKTRGMSIVAAEVEDATTTHRLAGLGGLARADGTCGGSHRGGPCQGNRLREDDGGSRLRGLRDLPLEGGRLFPSQQTAARQTVHIRAGPNRDIGQNVRPQFLVGRPQFRRRRQPRDPSRPAA